MSDQERHCANCSYFAGVGDGEGDCRRYAPRPASDRRETMWVTVAESDWCGDFLAK